MATEPRPPSPTDQPDPTAPELHTILSIPYWPLGPAFLRMCRALPNPTPRISAALSKAETAYGVNCTMDHPSAVSQTKSRSELRPEIPPIHVIPASLFTPDLGDSFDQAASSGSSSGLSLKSASSPQVAINAIGVTRRLVVQNGDYGLRSWFKAPTISPGDDMSLDGTPILDDAGLLKFETDLSLNPPSASKPALPAKCQPQVHNDHHKTKRDVTNLTAAEDIIERKAQKKRPSSPNGPSGFSNSRRRISSNGASSGQASVMDDDQRDQHLPIEDESIGLIRTAQASEPVSLTAWLDSCIASGEPAAPLPTVPQDHTAKNAHTLPHELKPAFKPKTDHSKENESEMTSKASNKSSHRPGQKSGHARDEFVDQRKGSHRDRHSVDRGSDVVSTLSSSVNERYQLPTRPPHRYEGGASRVKAQPLRSHPYKPHPFVPKEKSQSSNPNYTKLANTRRFTIREDPAPEPDVHIDENLEEGEINVPQLLDAIDKVKSGSSRLRSEGFIGDEAEVQKTHRQPRLASADLQKIHPDRRGQCASNVKPALTHSVSSHSDHVSKWKPVTASLDGDPFPLDPYILSVIQNCIGTYWNRCIIEAFCRIGIWLEGKGVWEHGNWGTLLSNELARFIDIGGNSRLANILAFHRPKKFEEVLVISAKMHFLQITKDITKEGTVMRVRLNKDFTPRGLFYRPLIRGMRRFTFQERTCVADRNLLETMYVAPSAPSGDISKILPPDTGFRKYTHWAEKEGVVTMACKDVKDPKGPKDIKLDHYWVSKDYAEDEPAPSYKLESSLVREIEDLMNAFSKRRS